MKNVIVLLLVMTWTLAWATESHNHVIARVKKGEGAGELLQRHLLTPHECNLEEFYKINSLSSGGYLIYGKIYKLPLLIVSYNGKSIRSTIGVDDFDYAKKIEKLNLDLLEVGIRDKHFTDNNRLWVPVAEFDCDNEESTVLPVIEGSEYVSSTSHNVSKTALAAHGEELKNSGVKKILVPLMGKDYENIDIEDYSLAGQVFYIISGHGGPDPGAVCKSCPQMMCEDEYAYDVALRLARNLLQHGATVEMIVQDPTDGVRDDQFLKCDTDEKTLGSRQIARDQKARLRDRAYTVNQLYKQYAKMGYKTHKAIEIHVDSRSENKRQDVFFYYNGQSAQSKKMALNAQEVFARKYEKHQKGRGYHGFVEDRGIYMVRAVTPPMLFVELANIRNEADQKRLLLNTNRQALANWLFESLRQ
jgi:N-acetylmuramoyl-L-alanine amidase